MNTAEIKGNLARLLATENLVVEHRKVSTASFNVDTRVLTLPLWNASNSVYDLLVGHEVGHALYTPNIDWSEVAQVPKDYINVVEDSRIEKLMKRKYPGLSKTFFKGYQELDNEDFFSINDEELDNISFIDRINLHCKIGAFSVMPFDDEERVMVKEVENCETFDEVIAICQKIYDYSQQEKIDDVNQNAAAQGTTEKVESSDTTEPSNTETTDEGQTIQKDGDDEGEQLDENISAGGNAGGDRAETQRAFDENVQDLTETAPYFRDPVYVEIPKINLENIIVDQAVLQKHIDAHYGCRDHKRYDNPLEFADNSFDVFKKESQKEVNYLVKEFECKKAADSHARTSSARTGVLDCAKLHTYKYNEDLFKKVSVIPDGKNHGMIFILDWSGSMSNYLQDTIKQLLSLVMFCRKVNIPFEVYAFTYEWNNRFLDPEEHDYDPDEVQDKCVREENKFMFHKRFSLLNLLSSRTNSKNFDRQCRNIFRIGFFMNSYGVITPPGLDLSGTPLNESIIAMHEIIPMFKKMTGVQKINTVILTDGESNNISYNVCIGKGSEYTYWGQRAVDGDVHLRDRKTGHVYRRRGSNFNDCITTILLENLSHNFPEVNFLGFRILTGGDFSYLYRNTYNESSDNVLKKWRKDKSFVFKKQLGYNSLYLIASTSMNKSTDFEVSNDATKAQIAKAFKSMLKAKTTNKKILSSFVDMVA
jgi:hypothetical protein